MAAHSEQKHRRLVPRWRTASATAALGELEPARLGPRREVIDRKILEQVTADWKANRGLPFAADLVGAAFVLRDGSPDTREAAEYILKSGTPSDSLRAIARRVVDPDIRERRPLGVEEILVVDGQRQSHVRLLRRRLADEPRNSMLWTDLSHAFAVLGNRERAETSMNAALYLAPENRFVLRSAARLFIHNDQADRAYDLISRSGLTPNDPWLLATEVSAAQTVGRTPRHIRQSLRVIKDRSLAPRHISELAGAVATLELEAGSVRQARRLFRMALDDPNENVVAQARWAAEQLSPLREAVVESLASTPNSFEAQSWIAFRLGSWQSSFQNAVSWFEDQPFSRGPATHASYVAAVCLEEFEESAGAAKRGLIANPEDFTLHNNAAFALASLGRVKEATEHVERIRSHDLDDSQKVVLLATRGLIAYRSGRPEEGSDLYRRSMELAESVHNDQLLAYALLFNAREAIRASTRDAATAAIHALEETRGSLLPDVRTVAARVQAQFDDKRQR